jgi:hypothetical protein
MKGTQSMCIQLSIYPPDRKQCEVYCCVVNRVVDYAIIGFLDQKFIFVFRVFSCPSQVLVARVTFLLFTHVLVLCPHSLFYFRMTPCIK